MHGVGAAGWGAQSDSTAAVAKMSEAAASMAIHNVGNGVCCVSLFSERNPTAFAAAGPDAQGEQIAAELVEGSPNEMAEAAAQWGRHAAYTASRAAQAAQYAAQQAQTATMSAQNAVAQMQFLMNHPDLNVGTAASFSPFGMLAVLATQAGLGLEGVCLGKFSQRSRAYPRGAAFL